MAHTKDNFNRDNGLLLAVTSSEVIEVGAPTNAPAVGRFAYQIVCASWGSNSVLFRAKIKGAPEVEAYAAGGPERRTLAGTDVAGGTAITADSAGVVICDQFDLFVDVTINGGDPVYVYLRPMEG